MNSRELFSSVFHFPAGIAIDSIEPSVNELVIGVACEGCVAKTHGEKRWA